MYFLDFNRPMHGTCHSDNIYTIEFVVVSANK